MTNANDPIYPYAWTEGNDEKKTPIINTNPPSLTKREYFSILILQSIMNSEAVKTEPFWPKIKRFFGVNTYDQTVHYNTPEITKAAIQMADVLIEKLNKE